MQTLHAVIRSDLLFAELVQYAIDLPMAAEPGKVWNYDSGATMLLAYIFQKETGQEGVRDFV